MTRFGQTNDAVAGQPSLPISESEVDMVIALVVLAVRRARLRLLAENMTTENKISIEVHKELQVIQERRKIRFFHFILEGVINPPGTPVGKTAGRIDFQMLLLRNLSYYDAYFGIECKRVSRRDTKTTRYYVDSGVGKYARGIYGANHTCGMLVGYVLDPPINGVLKPITTRMKKAHAGAAPLEAHRTYRDAEILQGDVPRTPNDPIKLLHTFVRMHA